ncbi:hypothetical protein GOP47_0003307, partial [Adiantum capillus-veneris]
SWRASVLSALLLPEDVAHMQWVMSLREDCCTAGIVLPQDLVVPYAALLFNGGAFSRLWKVTAMKGVALQAEAARTWQRKLFHALFCSFNATGGLLKVFEGDRAA